MSDKVSLTLGGREVHWNITPDQSAYLAQALVQTLGPAEEGL